LCCFCGRFSWGLNWPKESHPGDVPSALKRNSRAKIYCHSISYVFAGSFRERYENVCELDPHSASMEKTLRALDSSSSELRPDAGLQRLLELMQRGVVLRLTSRLGMMSTPQARSARTPPSIVHEYRDRRPQSNKDQSSCPPRVWGRNKVLRDIIVWTRSR
jgi:hypothetical protein